MLKKELIRIPQKNPKYKKIIPGFTKVVDIEKERDPLVLDAISRVKKNF